MATSQNHWPALGPESTKLHTWVIPTKNGDVHLRLRNGSAGFILAHTALFIANSVAPLKGRVLDDWGYAYRPVRGYSTTLSNHASGTAFDANATAHPLGKVGTWPRKQAAKIRARLHWGKLGNAVRWGGDYHGRKDEMHFEINVSLPACERVAKRLMKTRLGKRILKANPGQQRVILS